MHYKNGREAKRGDLVRGTGYNLKYEFTGVLVHAQPEASACNCQIATMSHRCDINQKKVLGPDIEYGQLDAFVAIDPETGLVLGPEEEVPTVHGDIFPSYDSVLDAHKRPVKMQGDTHASTVTGISEENLNNGGGEK